MSISKLRDGLTQRPNLQMVFKFLVNRMKIEDFRKYGPIWPFGRCRPFWSTEFYELSMRDRRRVSDHNRRKFKNDLLSGLGWRRAHRQPNKQAVIDWYLRNRQLDL